MTPRTRTEPRPTPLRSRHTAPGFLLGSAVLVVLLLAPSLGEDALISRLTIDNPTAFDVNVEVAGDGRSGRFDLGTVTHETESIREEVADPGATWVLRFSYGGVDAGELSVERSTVRDAGWRLTVPTEVGERLAAGGFVASAR
jgi:hypothetical protein